MAATKTPNSAFTPAQKYIRMEPLEDVQYQVLDDACKLIWMADAWRWTIGSLANFNLSASTQDYAYGGSLSDYLYTWRAYVANGDTMQPLAVDPELPTTEVQLCATPSRIAKVTGAATFRVFPVPGTPLVGTWTVVQQYKKIAPTISVANAGTAGALIMDDEWFHVYFEAVLYYAFKYGFDSRAGTVQYDASKGQTIYTGQYGVLMAAIERMRYHEPIATEMHLRPDAPAKRR
jgi:hypothetical protein